MAGRFTYVIAGVTDARHICAAVFDVLHADIATVRVDAYSDYADQMPADIRSAEAWLRERGLLGADRDPAEAISIGRDDDVGWAIGRAYAVWSTRVTLLDRSDSVLASLDDGGRAVTLMLNAEQATSLAAPVRPARLERVDGCGVASPSRGLP
jgi:hypothetical protein